MNRTRTQSYDNHTYFPTMTPVAGLPGVVAFLLLGLGMARQPTVQNLALICLAFSVIVLALISRAYTVRLQDRIVRLEMQLRLERLGREHDFPQLSTAQLAALRFASNAELPGLLDRSLAENLTPDQIKRAVCDWQPDFYRT